MGGEGDIKEKKQEYNFSPEEKEGRKEVGAGLGQAERRKTRKETREDYHFSRVVFLGQFPIETSPARVLGDC